MNDLEKNYVIYCSLMFGFRSNNHIGGGYSNLDGDETLFHRLIQNNPSENYPTGQASSFTAGLAEAPDSAGRGERPEL